MFDIIKEGNPVLKIKAKEIDKVTTEDINTLKAMMNQLISSQIPELAEKYNLQPAVGLAAPQIGLSKRMFCVLAEDFDSDLHKIAFINPKIISKSKEMTYLPFGEGCLSVPRETEGLVPRHMEIKIRGLVYDFEKEKLIKKTLKLSGIISIIVQHEYDHLDGILYTDRMVEKIENIEPLYVIEDEIEDELE